MPIIKRYPNRKLYNTETKQYVTLDGIAGLVRAGDEVRVVDHTTSEDLTAVTLTQVVSAQEKKAAGFVPHSVLSSLVQAGGQTFAALQGGLALPSGLRAQVDQEITRRIRALVQAGELSEEQGRWMRDMLFSPSAPSHAAHPLEPTEDQVRRALERRGVPTRQEVERLAQRLDDLSSQLDQLGPGQRAVPASAKRARRART